MSALIAILGENLVDLLVSPDGSVNAVIGGGPLNVARTIARLGAVSVFYSGISADAFGVQIRDSLVNDGVLLGLPEAQNEPTTLAVVELNPAGPSYHFHLQGTAAFTLPASTTIDAPAALYFGTLGLLVEPMASVGEHLVLTAPEETLVMLDPNCRPSATADYAAYTNRIARLCARTDVLKVSTEDLDYLNPDLDHVAAAHLYLGLGVRVVLITDGPEPVTIVTHAETMSVPVPRTDIVDTVGAGDALTGGFLTWWTGHQRGRDDLADVDALREAVRAAIEISRRTCQQAGAQPPHAADLAQLDGWRWL